MIQSKLFITDKANFSIPVLSLWQPWASAVVTPHPEYPERGIKEFETRHWSTDRRQRILIHAAKKWDKEVRDVFYNRPSVAKYAVDLLGGRSMLPLGCLIGSVVIEGVITSEQFHAEGMKLSKTGVDEFWWGNWDPGRFGIKLSAPVLFKEPIPWKGKQTTFWGLPINEIPSEYHHHFKV